MEKSIEVTDTNNLNHTLIIHFVKQQKYVCQHCGSLVTPKTLRTKSQIIHYSSPYEKNITIKLYRRVFECNECNHTFKEDNPFSNKCKRISSAKIKAIEAAFGHRHKTFVDIAKDFNTTAKTIEEIFDNMPDENRKKLPKVLSIDEIYRRRLTKSHFMCILYDQFEDKIIDILPSRHKEYLKGYLAQIAKAELDNVYWVTIDLHKTYRDIAHMFFHNAIVCADSFHVIKNLHFYFNKIRVEIMNRFVGLKRYSNNAYSKYKKYYKLLFKDPGNLDCKKTWKPIFQKHLSACEVVDEILDINPDLREAYDLMVEYKIFNSTCNLDNAENALEKLIYKFKNSKFSWFRKFGNLLVNWSQEIINSFTIVQDTRISNGPLEETNRRTKEYLGLSYSAKDFKRTRKRLMKLFNK